MLLLLPPGPFLIFHFLELVVRGLIEVWVVVRSRHGVHFFWLRRHGIDIVGREIDGRNGIPKMLTVAICLQRHSELLIPELIGADHLDAIVVEHGLILLLPRRLRHRFSLHILLIAPRRSGSIFHAVGYVVAAHVFAAEIEGAGLAAGALDGHEVVIVDVPTLLMPKMLLKLPRYRIAVKPEAIALWLIHHFIEYFIL